MFVWIWLKFIHLWDWGRTILLWTNIIQSCFKQNSQIWENVFWQLICIYNIHVWHFWLPIPYVVDLLKRVKMIGHNKVVSPMSMELLSKKLSYSHLKRIIDATYYLFVFHSCVIILYIYIYIFLLIIFFIHWYYFKK
jgi:hypothetical protein